MSAGTLAVGFVLDVLSLVGAVAIVYWTVRAVRKARAKA